MFRSRVLFWVVGNVTEVKQGALHVAAINFEISLNIAQEAIMSPIRLCFGESMSCSN